MPGYGSPPPDDQANNPNRQVGPTTAPSGGTPAPDTQPAPAAPPD